jgi:branched-chain amino acid transport system substrate-binding protein
MRRWIVLLLVIALAIFALGCQGATKTQETTKATDEAKEPYKIGAVVSVTGPAAPLGEPEKKTLLMETEKINEAGGINGHKIELFIEDDESNPANAATAVSKLIDEKGVIAILGGTITPSTMAMKTETAKTKTPHISMAAGVQITEAPNEWIFRTAQSDAVAVQKVIDYLSKSLKVKKFAILHDSNGFGQSGADELQKRAPRAGLEVVATEKYNTEDANMTSQLTKIKGTAAEVVVVWGTNPGPARAAKNMKELGMTIPFVGSHGIANMKFIELAGDAAEGVVFPAGKIIVSSSASGEQAEVIEGFMSDYKAKYNEGANSFAGHAYDAFHILVKALEKAGGDKEALRNAIENIGYGDG